MKARTIFAAPTSLRRRRSLRVSRPQSQVGFHAPQEALRILGESINFARKGHLTLRAAK